MIIKSNHKNTVYVGDIHGDFGRLHFDIFKKYKLSDTLIICLGDIGIGFKEEKYYKHLFDKINRQLNITNNTLIFFRGNHDNPIYFNGINKNWNNIYLANDYSIIDQNNIKSLIVGGGLSIDRSVRKNNHNYWKNEFIKLTDINREWLNKQKNISIILTHIAPTGIYPYTKGNINYWIKKDKNLIDDVNNQRNILKEIFNILQKNGNNIIEWYYGHYHKNNFEIINNIKYRCINSNDFYFRYQN